MKNTKIRLTLGNLVLNEQNVLKLELTTSVFLSGEIGSCSISLPGYEDIYKLSTTGTLNMTDSFDGNFWPTPLNFVVVDKYTILQQNGLWLVSFSFVNKYAALLYTGFDASYKNKSISDILQDILLSKVKVPNVKINNATNQYYDNPIIFSPQHNSLDFIKYLLIRSNPINSDILLFFIDKDTANITLPHRKTIIDKIDMFLGIRNGSNFVENYTFNINPNITVFRGMQSQLNVLSFDDTQVDETKYNQMLYKLYTDVYDKYKNIIVTNNVGYITNDITSILYTGEDDQNKLLSILTYMIGRLLFDTVTLEVKLLSNNKYKIDNQVKIIFYKNLAQELIDMKLSDTYYLMGVKREFKIVNSQIPGNEENILDEMTLTLVKSSTKIASQ